MTIAPIFTMLRRVRCAPELKLVMDVLFATTPKNTRVNVVVGFHSIVKASKEVVLC
jgi:hypothetical protein